MFTECSGETHGETGRANTAAGNAQAGEISANLLWRFAGRRVLIQAVTSFEDLLQLCFENLLE